MMIVFIVCMEQESKVCLRLKMNMFIIDSPNTSKLGRKYWSKIERTNAVKFHGHRLNVSRTWAS